jgi:hypothetical protein
VGKALGLSVDQVDLLAGNATAWWDNKAALADALPGRRGWIRTAP